MKKMLSLMLCLFLLLCAAACSDDFIPPPGSDADTSAAGPALAQSGAATAPGSIAGVDGELRIVNSNGWSCSNENGRYEVFSGYGDSANIMYADYTTAQEIVLCNRPECLHADDSCTGWRKSITYLGQAGDRLILVTGGNYIDNENFEPYVLEICDLNGSNRRVISSVNGINYFSGQMAYDNSSLYTILSAMDETEIDEQTNRSRLVRFNIADGAMDELYAFDSGYPDFFDVVDNKLLFRDWAEQTWTDEDEAAMEAGTYEYLQQFTIFTLGIGGGAEKEELLQWTQSELDSSVFDGLTMYYTEAGKIKRMDMRSGETAEIGEIPQPGENDRYFINGIRDGRLVMELNRHSEDTYLWERWAVPLAGGPLEMCTLAMSSERVSDPLAQLSSSGGATARQLNYGGSADPVEIYAETADSFLVLPRIDFTTTKYEGMENDWYNVDVELRKFALISKADYWANTPNYTMIDMTARTRVLMRDLAAISST